MFGAIALEVCREDTAFGAAVLEACLGSAVPEDVLAALEACGVNTFVEAAALEIDEELQRSASASALLLAVAKADEVLLLLSGSGLT